MSKIKKNHSEASKSRAHDHEVDTVKPFKSSQKIVRIKKLSLLVISLACMATGLYIFFLLNYPRIVDRFTPYGPDATQLLAADKNTITIPSAKIQANFETGGSDVLDRGLAWHRFPERGDPENGGNFIISGHRFVWSLNPATVRDHSIFFFLDKVKIGDEIQIRWDNKDYKYIVTELKEVKPNATEIEQPTTEPQLTIYTCTLGGSADGRVVVIAKPVEGHNAGLLTIDKP